MTQTTHKALLSAAALAVLAALAGCGDRSDNPTVGQRVDSTMDRTADAARRARQEARQDIASAAETTREKAHQAADATRAAAGDARTSVMGAAAESRQKTAGATDAMGSRAEDVRITSSVKAGLAGEKELSAARIDVDTQDGVVTLSGAVGTAAAKARAGEVAHQVKDVKSVNNQLTLAAN